jgi:hypothetical protein
MLERVICMDVSWSVRSEDDTARLPTFHGLVSGSDLLERERLADLEREPPLAQAGGEIRGGAALGVGWEVVAAQQSDRDVEEEQRPERQRRRGTCREVAGDDAALRDDVRIQLRIGGEGDVDDAVDTVRRGVADLRGELGL